MVQSYSKSIILTEKKNTKIHHPDWYLPFTPLRMLSDSLYEAKFNHAGEIMQAETEKRRESRMDQNLSDRYWDSMRLNGIENQQKWIDMVILW